MQALVIGYGSIGKRHIENLSKLPNIKILVCSKRKYDVFLKSKNCVLINSLEDCINQKPNFAIICNETSFHIKTAIKLAKSGIHLFIEKPLSNSLKGINELMILTRKKKIITMIGNNFRFHPSIKLIKKMISSKDLGRIISAKVENGSFLPYWHPNENYSKNYSARDDLGGGVILTCIHEIDYLYWFFGNVSNVFSISGKFSDLDIQTEDLSAILLKFENNVIAEAHLDYFQIPSIRNCKIICTKGTIIWDMHQNIVRFYDNKNKKWIEKLKLTNYEINSMYLEELKYFIKCIRENKKTNCDIEDGIYTLKIALSIKKSSKFQKIQMIEK